MRRNGAKVIRCDFPRPCHPVAGRPCSGSRRRSHRLSPVTRWNDWKFHSQDGVPGAAGRFCDRRPGRSTDIAAGHAARPRSARPFTPGRRATVGAGGAGRPDEACHGGTAERACHAPARHNRLGRAPFQDRPELAHLLAQRRRFGRGDADRLGPARGLRRRRHRLAAAGAPSGRTAGQLRLQRRGDPSGADYGAEGRPARHRRNPDGERLLAGLRRGLHPGRGGAEDRPAGRRRSADRRIPRRPDLCKGPGRAAETVALDCEISLRWQQVPPRCCSAGAEARRHRGRLVLSLRSWRGEICRAAEADGIRPRADPRNPARQGGETFRASRRFAGPEGKAG